ncbi:MAG: small multi-drug export protein [Planctomycetia bacterium]|nr:small multi-drug export protein [Planctomycetia bacterium]
MRPNDSNPETNQSARLSSDLPGDASSPIVWWTTLLAPLVASALVLLALGMVRGWTAVVGIVGVAFASLFLGKFIILGGPEVESFGLTALDLAALVVLMDVLAACWFVYHLRFMLRLPVLGPKFALVIQDGEYVLATYPGIRRAAFVGLVIFVAIPFSMTGSVGGAILARLLGMSQPATFRAICLGSVLGAALMYLGGQTIETSIGRDNPVWRWGGFLILTALIVLIQYRYTKAKKRLAAGTHSFIEPERHSTEPE